MQNRKREIIQPNVYRILPKVNQVIYTLDIICEPNIMILAEVVVNRKPLSLCPFVAGLKKIALKSDFIYIFFMFHHMYIAPGRGRQSIGDKILMTTERPFLFARMLQVSK